MLQSAFSHIDARNVPAATVTMPKILRRRGASLVPTQPLLFTVRSNPFLGEGIPCAVTLNSGAVAHVAVDVLRLQKTGW